MAPRRFLLLQRCVSVGYSASPSSPPCTPVATARTWWLHVVSLATDSAGDRNCSSVATVQKADVSAKWHGLPPVPKQGRRWAAWELNNAKRTLEENASAHEDEKGGVENNGHTIIALRWVTKCCPNLPNSLLHKLFRLRQVRKRARLSTSSNTQHQERPSDVSNIEQLETQMRRVSGKAVLEEGTVLYLPKSVFQNQADVSPKQYTKKIQHQPTTDEVTWLQSLVLYRDPEILVINKPPGLPVQGGSEIKRSLDSLMGSALSFGYTDGPRLVHRLDKDTSGIMVLARTQECAMLLHALFREKTATVAETRNVRSTIERFYRALVVGTPKQSQGRITAPLIKVVLDEGRVDKTMVAHDFSSENAQVAITDYKVLGRSYLGCTWLELRPLTGRKHQLRVHCAEVLGTPVLGDMRYGWRTHKEWLSKMKSQDSQTLAMGTKSEMNLEAGQCMKITKGSMFARLPQLHLHCCQMTLPNISQMLEQDRSRLKYEDVGTDSLQFVAPLPPHMAASRDLWDHNSLAVSKLKDGCQQSYNFQPINSS